MVLTSIDVEDGGSPVVVSTFCVTCFDDKIIDMDRVV